MKKNGGQNGSKTLLKVGRKSEKNKGKARKESKGKWREGQQERGKRRKRSITNNYKHQRKQTGKEQTNNKVSTGKQN